MNESYKRGLYRHERRESGRGTEQQRNGRARVKKQTWMMRSHIHVAYTPHRGDWTGNLCIAALLPPFSPLSFAPLALLQSLGWGIGLLYSYLIMKVNKRSIVALIRFCSEGKGFPKAVGGPWRGTADEDMLLAIKCILGNKNKICLPQKNPS